MGDGSPERGPGSPGAHSFRSIARVLPEGEGTLTTVPSDRMRTRTCSRDVARRRRCAHPYVPGERRLGGRDVVLSATYGMALRNPSIELPEG